MAAAALAFHYLSPHNPANLIFILLILIGSESPPGTNPCGQEIFCLDWPGLSGTLYSRNQRQGPLDDVAGKGCPEMDSRKWYLQKMGADLSSEHGLASLKSKNFNRNVTFVLGPPK